LALALLASPLAAQAQVSQISAAGIGCGEDYLGNSWLCNAGEIAISQVIDVQVQGDPTQCVVGESLLITTATVNYDINTNERNDLTLWIGDQEGTDPRLAAGVGQSCSAFSVPGPFNATPDATNPWGNEDGDQCGDLGFSVANAARTFTNVAITCQDNDNNGFADLQILLTWDQNATAACGTGAGQAFPTDGGTRSKCDYGINNTNIVVVEATAELTLDKTSPTANYDDPADTLSYSYLVTNSGQLPLDFPVSVSDNRATVTCPANDGGAPNNGDAVLDPGESIACSATYDVSQADIDGGSVTNTATASADGTQSNQDSVTVNAVQNPALTVVKSSTTVSVTEPGSVAYSYLVTNTGNVSLTGIALSDDNDNNDLSCPATSLAPGANMTCTASHTVTQGEIDANGSPTADSGLLSNTVTAASDQAADQQDDLDIPIAQRPALQVTKSGTWNDDGSVANIAEAGETISYTIDVENTGNTTLSSVAVTDPLITNAPNSGTITCPGGNPIPSLAPGASVQCTATYSVTAADVTAGSVDNTATASDGETTNQDDENVLLPAQLSISVVKTGVFQDDTAADGFAQAGETIDYTFEVTNDSASTVNNVSVSDPLVPAITCPGGNPIPSLAGGASVTCTGTYTLLQGDVDLGQVDNTVTVDSDETPPANDDETVPLVQNPSFTIVKTGEFQDESGDGFAQPGETIAYTIEVTNDGFVTLNNISVTDPKVTPVNCPGGNPILTLAPGATVQCSGSYSIVEADITLGRVDNTATGDPEDLPPGNDDESTPLGQAAQMTIEKSSATALITAPGTVLYSYLVTNTGNVELTGISLSDDNDEDDLSCPSTSLAALATMTCTASHSVTQDEIDANGSPTADSGLLSNLVTGTATGLAEPVTDDLDIPIEQDPGMTVEKSSPTNTVTGTGPVSYNYVVTNTGNVTLTNILLSDDNDEDDLSCPQATLATGQSMNCTATHDVTMQELEDNGSPVPGSGFLANTVTASSDQAPQVTDQLSLPIEVADLARFRVTKDFSDDNPAEVEVFISCNTGLPLQQSFVISEETLVVFVVDAFNTGEMDCHITENPVPAGYSESYAADVGEGGFAGSITADAEGCHFEEVQGGLFECVISNELDPVDVLVTKEWIINNEGSTVSLVAGADYACHNARDEYGSLATFEGSLHFEGATDTEVIEGVYPDYGGSTYCTVSEVSADSYAEADASDCASVPVSLGADASCTIYNTVFFEGIPTLNQYGLILLALLMLGVGAVSFRRYV
jgi:uncharacterized repeat protein (TIGR01451 family)